MSSRTKKPNVTTTPEPKLKTTAELYNELDEEIREGHKTLDSRKSDLLDKIYQEAPQYLEEIDKKRAEEIKAANPSLFRKLLQFLMNW